MWRPERELAAEQDVDHLRGVFVHWRGAVRRAIQIHRIRRTGRAFPSRSGPTLALARMVGVIADEALAPPARSCVYVNHDETNSLCLDRIPTDVGSIGSISHCTQGEITLGWELEWFDADGTSLDTCHSTEPAALEARLTEWLTVNPASRIYVYRLRHAAGGGSRISVLERIVTTERRPEG